VLVGCTQPPLHGMEELFVGAEMMMVSAMFPRRCKRRYMMSAFFCEILHVSQSNRDIDVCCRDTKS
jgi:hypothetical protein